MINKKDVTIIIPHLGGTPETKYAYLQCIDSLEETFGLANVVTVTNGYEPSEERDIGNIHISAQGQCKAVNAAVATVDTEWIMVTNDDMVYPPDWWGKLTKDIITEKCISPKLIEPRPGAPTFEVFFAGGAGGDFDKRKWLEFAANYKASPAPFRTGFNLPFLMKKDLWDLIGGYDVNYDPWGSNSDSDLEYKIKLAGVQPYQNVNCIVYHFSQTSGTFHPDNSNYWQKNYAYFEQKWGFPRTDNGIWEASFKVPSFREGRLYRPWWEGFYTKS